MYTLIIIFHVIVCLLLIAIILIQSGRGGGFLESFSGLDSFFGTKTNTFLVRTTAVLATLFLLTCLSLAFLSSQRSKSLIEKTPSQQLSPLGPQEDNVPAGGVESLPSKENTNKLDINKETQEKAG